MSMIDTQNAKQIRDPMDVLITMELPDEGVTLTYSGYSTAKVADGELGETAWPMRQIADLQGEGFSLDGSHVLYNPSTPASAANGKIGVRSNIGETVTVTVTANRSVASLTIFATGASSVEYNGQTAAIVGGSVVIPVGATSVTLTFNPVSETERIEVSDITAGTTFRITNESLIKAVVSLRSDLSPFGQTLPESEINIDVYQDADISEVVAAIPEDTPITYRAGYPGDMSPVRKFYVSGKVTWADNVLHIQGVDAVHFLDTHEVGAPIMCNDTDYFERLGRYMLEKAGIQFVKPSHIMPYANSWAIIPKGTKFRDFIAFMNQSFNVSDRQGNLLSGHGKLPRSAQYAYIDAGIPTVRTMTPRWSNTIKEEDCASVTKEITPMVGEVSAEWDAIVPEGDPARWGSENNIRVGSATLVKGVGATLEFNALACAWTIGVDMVGADGDTYGDKILSVYEGYGTHWGILTIVPADSAGNKDTNSDRGGIYYPLSKVPKIESYGYLLVAPGVTEKDYRSYPTPDDRQIYTSFVPWSMRFDEWLSVHPIPSRQPTVAQVWDIMTRVGVFPSGADSVELAIGGVPITFNHVSLAYSGAEHGEAYNFSALPWQGRLLFELENGEKVELYPHESMTSGMYRSQVSYSFVWKGDPRMQPRDVVLWQRLDGTMEEITMENITLTHEKGGTLAEITARKGVI